MMAGLRMRFGAILLLLATAACESATDPGDTLSIPPRGDDGWETASLESVGLDPAPLQALLAHIDSTPAHLIHGIVIVKDDRLVFEHY